MFPRPHSFMLSFRQLVSVGIPTRKAQVVAALQTRVPLESPAAVGCPVARTAEIIGNKWTPLIVRDLARGHRRFSELERSLSGISPKTLSERLKRLEEARVVDRACFAEVPPRVEYSLTAKGFALLPVIESMRAFGAQWLEPEGSCSSEEDA